MPRGGFGMMVITLLIIVFLLLVNTYDIDEQLSRAIYRSRALESRTDILNYKIYKLTNSNMITRNEFRRMVREIMDNGQCTYNEKIEKIADIYEVASQSRIGEECGDDTLTIN